MADLREQIDMTHVTPVCAKATAKNPQGRTGTTAGYAAHRAHGEMACEACIAAWTAKCADYDRVLTPEERERRNELKLASGRRSHARKQAEDAVRDACAEGLRGTSVGHDAHIAAGQRPCKPCRQSPTEPGAACARPTLRFPEGRTGTAAGYGAHRDAGEGACQSCISAQTVKSNERRRNLSGEELERYRWLTNEATRRRRERAPEAVRAAKHRRMAVNRAIVRSAKEVPCTDCGIQYPYYVMQFDHLNGAEKDFNIGHRGPTLGEARLLAEIAKCEVVCANCHFERTYQRAQARKGAQADAV